MDQRIKKREREKEQKKIERRKEEKKWRKIEG